MTRTTLGPADLRELAEGLSGAREEALSFHVDTAQPRGKAPPEGGFHPQPADAGEAPRERLTAAKYPYRAANARSLVSSYEHMICEEARRAGLVLGPVAPERA